MTTATTTTYTIDGMTCAHCVAAVTEEISTLAGVEHVTVSLADGTAVVVGDADASAVAGAVAEAGYEVVDRR